MRVALFTESLPPNTDGVVNTLCHLVDTLGKNGVDFRFYSPVKPDRSFPWSDKVRKVASVPFALYSYYKVGIPYLHNIQNELDVFEPDIIHVCSPTLLGMYGLNQARRRGIPAVTSYHTHFVRYFTYYGLEKLEPLGWQYLQWFHNQFDRTYAPTPSAACELTRQGIENVTLWQRGIELERFSPLHRNRDLRESVDAADRPLLLFVGRLVREKDLEDLAEAHKILTAKGYSYRLAVVGDGPMREELKNLIPDAHFPGVQYGHQLAEWFASADLFVFPSTTETFGNVVLESFASGVPVVGVDKGGQADLIHHEKNGLIARHNDPPHFAEQIARFLENPAWRRLCGQTARRSAAAFSWDRINRNLLEDYASLLRTRKAA